MQTIPIIWKTSFLRGFALFRRIVFDLDPTSSIQSAKYYCPAVHTIISYVLKFIGWITMSDSSFQEQSSLVPSVMINAVTKKLAKKLGADSFMTQDSSDDNISKVRENVCFFIFVMSLVKICMCLNNICFCVYNLCKG